MVPHSCSIVLIFFMIFFSFFFHCVMYVEAIILIDVACLLNIFFYDCYPDSRKTASLEVSVECQKWLRNKK